MPPQHDRLPPGTTAALVLCGFGVLVTLIGMVAFPVIALPSLDLNDPNRFTVEFLAWLRAQRPVVLFACGNVAVCGAGIAALARALRGSPGWALLGLLQGVGVIVSGCVLWGRWKRARHSAAE